MGQVLEESKKGKSLFSSLNYHESLVFLPQLRNRVLLLLELSKPEQMFSRHGFDPGFGCFDATSDLMGGPHCRLTLRPIEGTGPTRPFPAPPCSLHLGTLAATRKAAASKARRQARRRQAGAHSFTGDGQGWACRRDLDRVTFRGIKLTLNLELVVPSILGSANLEA